MILLTIDWALIIEKLVLIAVVILASLGIFCTLYFTGFWPVPQPAGSSLNLLFLGISAIFCRFNLALDPGSIFSFYAT